jgi:ribosomal protein L32
MRFQLLPFVPQQPSGDQNSAGCGGKQGFNDYGMAHTIARRMRRNNGRTAPHAYKCATCGLWHIGSHVSPQSYRGKRTTKRVSWSPFRIPRHRIQLRVTRFIKFRRGL